MLSEAEDLAKEAFVQLPSYDALIPVLLEQGVKGLPDACKLTPGIPIKPMLAFPTKALTEVLDRFENLKFTCEYKYDGERAQVFNESCAFYFIISRFID